MKALLLAAGLGTRLRPVTDMVPKCLVPINGYPLLKYWLDHLHQAGIGNFIINTHYKAEQVEAFVHKSTYCDRVTLIHEDDLLLTGGTLLACSELFQNETCMVVHADNLSFCDFEGFIQAHENRPKQCVMTMMTFCTDRPENCGIVLTNHEGIVTEFHEKVSHPPGNLANGAAYIIEPEVIAYLKSLNKKTIDFSTEVIPAFIHRIFTYENKIYHRDIGDLKSYAMAQIECQPFISGGD